MHGCSSTRTDNTPHGTPALTPDTTHYHPLRASRSPVTGPKVSVAIAELAHHISPLTAQRSHAAPSLISSAVPGSFGCHRLASPRRDTGGLATKAEPNVVAAAPVATVLWRRGRCLLITSLPLALPVTCVGAHVAGEPGHADTVDGLRCAAGDAAREARHASGRDLRTKPEAAHLIRPDARHRGAYRGACCRRTRNIVRNLRLRAQRHLRQRGRLGARIC